MFTALLFLGSLLAGLLGALTGLGGGVVLVPLLTLGFHVDIRYAIGVSLISVIATSSGAAAAYVREGFSSVRIGMFLEVATTIGAILGAFLATVVHTQALAIIFGLVLIYSAYLSWQQARNPVPELKKGSPWSDKLRLSGDYPGPDGSRCKYEVENIPGGFGLMFVAGALSGLLGIGSGAVKVLAMDRIMKVPFKVSTTTSNFMIGVTAAASAGIYLHRGLITPGLAFPVMLGVLSGSLIGARYLVRAHVSVLRSRVYDRHPGAGSGDDYQRGDEMVLRAKPEDHGAGRPFRRPDHGNDHGATAAGGRAAGVVCDAGRRRFFICRAHQGGMPDYRVFKSEPQALRHIGGVMRGVSRAIRGHHSTCGVAADRDAGGAGGVCAHCLRDRAGQALYGVSAVVLAVLLFGFLPVPVSGWTPAGVDCSQHLARESNPLDTRLHQTSI